MFHVLQSQALVLSVISLVLLALKIYAFVIALTFPAEAYRAADKLTKPAWVLILGLAIVVSAYFALLNIVGLATLIATLVFLVDVRPALSDLRRR